MPIPDNSPVSVPLLVFTDLDGTLLSHSDYSWSAARPALMRLRALGAGVVLSSSKTVPEIDVIRRDMGLEDWPAIAENGAGMLPAGGAPDQGNTLYLDLQKVLRDIPAALRENFRGFYDMNTDEVSACTGLKPDGAALAKQRAFSEPGIWSGSAEDQRRFLSALSACGVTARAGGRFLTLSFGGTKADLMHKLIQQYRPEHTLALGDAPNDIEMLEAADAGVIIANPHHDPLPALKGEAQGRIMRTTVAGPEGWNIALRDHIMQLKLE